MEVVEAVEDMGVAGEVVEVTVVAEHIRAVEVAVDTEAVGEVAVDMGVVGVAPVDTEVVEEAVVVTDRVIVPPLLSMVVTTVSLEQRGGLKNQALVAAAAVTGRKVEDLVRATDLDLQELPQAPDIPATTNTRLAVIMDLRAVDTKDQE